jgi:sigma-B regulation protein RsbU (phosphoserine phosphatase)
MSLFLGEVNLRTGELRYASAGHAPGVVYRARSGAFDELKPTGPALGIVENAVYEVCAVVPPLQGEDALLLYTDGATEAMGEQRELYGLGRLKQRLAAVHGRRAPDIVDALTRSITTYADGKLDDDVSFLVVKANGQRLPVQPPIPEADAATA